MEKNKETSTDSADESSKKKKKKKKEEDLNPEEDTKYKSGQLLDMAKALKIMPIKQHYCTRHLQMTNLSLRALIYVCINFRRK
mmetsp:Transcript_7215/g.9147  ORF Transcript_7215/g.9147 Transcript_7215/m.9147 type:complete len:83 (+) Transcript_7215:229-477(+)